MTYTSLLDVPHMQEHQQKIFSNFDVSTFPFDGVFTRFRGDLKKLSGGDRFQESLGSIAMKALIPSIWILDVLYSFFPKRP